MQNQIISMMMNQVRARNPQAFQMLEQARKNNNNPMELLKQVTKEYSPEQINGLFEKSKQFGISDEVISQIKDSMK